MNNILVSTSAQKVLDFLIQNPGKQFLAKDVQRATGVSRAGANLSLYKLAKQRLILREKKAKIYLYSVDHNNPVIKQLKVLRTTVLLEPLISTLKELSQKIVLFGSCARGENIADSDIDLLILTNTPKSIQEKTNKSKLRRKLQPVICNLAQFLKMEKEEPVFTEEIEHGIIMWESKDESRI